MSFVPVTGPARLLVGDPPREGSVEFTSETRTVSLPLKAALPVLARARRDDDAHPSVQMLAGAAVLGLTLVAQGKFGPAREGDTWQLAGLDEVDRERIALLARARAHDGFDAATAEGIVWSFLVAVADAMPSSGPSGSSAHRRTTTRGGGRAATRPSPGTDETPTAGPRPDPESFSEALQRRVARLRARASDDRPHLVTLSLRLEADEEELVAGAVRLVLQVRAVGNPAHVADAALLWAESGPDASHGFGDRARTHTAILLRAAADAWPVLDRLADLRVPDEITLDSDEILSLLDGGAEALTEAGVEVLWPRYLDRDVTQRVELGSMGAREEKLQDGLFGPDALFGFRWQMALHGDPLTDDEMDQLASATRPIIKLRDNWVAVDSALLKRARKRLIREVAPVQALAATLTGAVEVDDVPYEAVVGASLLRVRDQLLGARTGEPVPVPTGLAATLRDYQREGLTWLAELTSLGLGGVLADDMGLGKTITLIALHLHRSDTHPGPTLVVCPTSLLGNWESEIRRFAPGTPVRRHHGSARDLDDVRDGLVLTTYGTMRNDADLLAEVPWGLVVADEAQHVKNSRSAAARALRSIPGRARVALTGTPVENDLTELWSILDWTVPGLLGSRAAFRKAWAADIESGKDARKTRQFADLIGPFLLRRRKSDPGIAPELPPKTETDHLIGLTREQVVLYESYVRDCMDRIEQADEESRRGLVLKLLTGLKQICNHPAHFLKQANPRVRGRSEKVELLDELIGTVLAEEGAVLVFTQYVAMADLLVRHLAAAGVPHQFLHGGTPVVQREEMVRRFQAGPDDPDHVPVFLLSLKAGGTGLNLTRADHVIHVDRWWNPAVEDQATDRAHRIGQTKPVQVHRFVTQGTIEEKIAELLARKRSLAEAVLARGDVALTELSDDELRDFVELRR